MSIAPAGMPRAAADQLRDSARLQRCDECDAEFLRTFRADKLTCSPACRKRRQRRLAAES